MHHKVLNVLAFIAAFALASCSAYFSVIGLQAIFAAAFWSIILMGAVLEVAKLVTASWLYRHWKVTPIFLRFYLSFAILVLMGITSMGVFGYLSKAHIEQGVDNTMEVAEKAAQLDEKIKYQQSVVDDYANRIQQIDNAVNESVKRGRSNGGINIATSQSKVRAQAESAREKESQSLIQMKSDRAVLESKIKRLEAEVGPLKYLNAMFSDDQSVTALEKAVRWVIVLIVAVFDPLAVLLLIAANLGVAKSDHLMFKSTGKHLMVLKDKVHSMEDWK